MKKVLSILLTLAIMVSLFAGFAPATETEAASKNISVKSFNKLFKKSIKNKEAQKLLPRASAKAITRLEAARILAQAYEILNPKKVASDEDVELTLNGPDGYIGRILDFYNNPDNKDYVAGVSKDDQIWFTKAYMYGLITAKSWETGAHSYTFKAKAKMTKSDAKASIKALKSAKKRYKLSDDYQMIRTTNLPEHADWYPYILTTFPNEYYDQQLEYMRDVRELWRWSEADGFDKVMKKYGFKLTGVTDTFYNLLTSKQEYLDIYKKLAGTSFYDYFPTKADFDRVYSWKGTGDIYFVNNQFSVKDRIKYIKEGKALVEFSNDRIDYFDAPPGMEVSSISYVAEDLNNYVRYLSPAEFYKVKDEEFFSTWIDEAAEYYTINPSTGVELGGRDSHFNIIGAIRCFNYDYILPSHNHVIVDTSTLYIANGELVIKIYEKDYLGNWMFCNGAFSMANIIREKNGKVVKDNLQKYYEKSYGKKLSERQIERLISQNRSDYKPNQPYADLNSSSGSSMDEEFGAYMRSLLKQYEETGETPREFFTLINIAEWPMVNH